MLALATLRRCVRALSAAGGTNALAELVLGDGFVGDMLGDLADPPGQSGGPAGAAARMAAAASVLAAVQCLPCCCGCTVKHTVFHTSCAAFWCTSMMAGILSRTLLHPHDRVCAATGTIVTCVCDVPRWRAPPPVPAHWCASVCWAASSGWQAPQPPSRHPAARSP